MRSCFRSLELEAVRYLLISGQATVLYGAATFSEDIDFWVDPDPGNWQRLILALRRMGARVYKLTPPMEPHYVGRGHGFHFRMSDDGGAPAYLDVMGVPPRVGRFEDARARSLPIDTPWGLIPVVGMEELVELKKTRRLADYDIISNLVKIRLGAAGLSASRDLLEWALRNSFRVEDLCAILESWPEARELAARLGRPSLDTLLETPPGTETSPDVQARTRSQLNEELATIQHADVLYWSPVLQELRELRRTGRLLVEGSAI